MHKCHENMNAMLVLKFSKHKTYKFKKFLIFQKFQKFEKLGMLQTTIPLKGISSRDSKRLERMGLKTPGFGNWVGYDP